MDSPTHVSFYEQIGIEHDLSSFLANGVTIMDFAVAPWGAYLLGLSDGSIVVGQRELNVIEWSLVEVFSTSLQKILVGPTSVFAIGVDEGLQPRSRLAGIFSSAASSQPHACFTLAVLSYSQSRRRQSTATGMTLTIRQKIPSLLSMAMSQTIVTTMSVTEDEHYLLLGTNKGQLEVIRLNKSKSIYITEIGGTTAGKGAADNRISVQSVFIIPSTEGTRLAWILGSALTSVSAAQDSDKSVAYLSLYAFNGYGSHLHSLSRLVSPQPLYRSTILCDYNSSFPANAPKNAIGTITYFNYAKDLQILEILTPSSLKNLTLTNPNDIAKVDTIIRTPHPLLYSSLAMPLTNLQRNSTNHLFTLDLSGAIKIYDSSKLIYSAIVPQLEYKVVVSPVTNSFILLATSSPQNCTITEIRLLSDHACVKSLINNNLYTEALTMAKQSNCSLTSLDVTAIHMQYAEYLFNQGQLEQSVDEYSLTSKLLEPCVVLSKFLHKNRVDLMVHYILSISRAGKADDAHIRMLFNCYEKLGQRDAIHAFIREAIQVYQSTNGQQCTIRNIKGAYDALRDIGMIDEALLLSICLGESLLGMNLLIEAGRYTEVFCLLAIMDMDDCRSAILEFGRELIKHSPQEICKIIKRLCVMFSSEQLNNLPVRYRQAVLMATKAEPQTIPMWMEQLSRWNRQATATDQVFLIDEFLHIFTNSSLNSSLLDIFNSIFARVRDHTLGYDSFTPATATVFFELQLRLKVSEAEILKNLKDYIELINYAIENAGSATTTRLKSPDMGASTAASTVVSTTKAKSKEKAAKRTKKLRLEIRDGLTRLLVQFYLHDFKAGILRLLQMNLEYVKCIRFYINTGDLYSASEAYARMLDDAEFIRDTTFEKDIWIQLLAECIVANNIEVTGEVLRTVLRQKEIPREQVLQVISATLPHSRKAPKSAAQSAYMFEPDEPDTAGVKGLVTGTGTDGRLGMSFGPFGAYLLSAAEDFSASLCDRVETMLDSQAQLQLKEDTLASLTGPQQWTKGVCSRCNFRLEPPIVHLGCGHAFHSNCLQEQENCPHCYPKDTNASAPVLKVSSGQAMTFTGLIDELLCSEVAQFLN